MTRWLPEQLLPSSGGGGGGGAVDSVNGQTGAVVLDAADVGAVPTTGGTMTGALVLPGDPATALQAATRQFALANGPVSSVNTKTGAVALTAGDVGALPIGGGTLTGALVLNAAPSVALGAATKGYVDGRTAADVGALPIGGGTLTGALILAGAPSTTLQAATKGYVDTAVATPVAKRSVRVIRSAAAAQSIPNATATPVTLTGVTWSQGGGTWWTTGTTLTVPTGGTRIYVASVRAIFQEGATPTGFRGVWFRRVLDDYNVAAQSTPAPGNGNWTDLTATDQDILTAGEQYRVIVRQDSGGALDLYALQVTITELSAVA